MREGFFSFLFFSTDQSNHHDAVAPKVNFYMYAEDRHVYVIPGTAVIVRPIKRTHGYNHSFETKASLNHDINEGC